MTNVRQFKRKENMPHKPVFITQFDLFVDDERITSMKIEYTF